MILKVSPVAISLGDLATAPGPSAGCYHVRIEGIPEGVAVAQVILLFTHTVRKTADKGKKYEFDFAELNPIADFL